MSQFPSKGDILPDAPDPHTQAGGGGSGNQITDLVSPQQRAAAAIGANVILLEAIDPVTGLPSGADLAADCNSTDTEVVFRNPGLDVLSIEAIRQAGTLSTAEFTVYFSTTGFSAGAYQSGGSAVKFTGSDGGVHGLRVTGIPYIIVRVTTAQGGASTAVIRATGGRDAA